MSAFVRAARFVGDLDDEFYADELQRDAWNEASAVGLQSLLWIGLISAAILPYAAGVTGAWVALGILLALIVASTVVQGYARSRGVEVYSAQEFRRPRLAIAVILYLVGSLGAIVRLFDTFGDGSLATWVGLATGAAAGACVSIVIFKLRQRRVRKAELAAEKAELQGFEETD